MAEPPSPLSSFQRPVARGCRVRGYLPAFQHQGRIWVPSPGWPWVNQCSHIFAPLTCLPLECRPMWEVEPLPSASGRTPAIVLFGVTAFGGECRLGGCGQGLSPLTEHSVLPRGKLESEWPTSLRSWEEMSINRGAGESYGNFPEGENAWSCGSQGNLGYWMTSSLSGGLVPPCRISHPHPKM